MAESQIGLYKSELIHHEGPWRNVDQVEAATADWVHWFNTERIHSSIDDITPIELEGLDYALTEPLDRVGQHQQFALRTRRGDSTCHQFVPHNPAALCSLL